MLLRLAHGWIDKKKLRYCWKCHKILPRDESFFRRRLKCKKNPVWSVKVGTTKDEWLNLSRRQRYAHLVETRCYSEAPDSSGLSCDFCRQEDMKDVKQGNHPIECPLCLEKELTFTFRPPRRPVVSRSLKKLFYNLVGTLNWILCLWAFLIVQIFELVGDLSKALWRKACQRNR